MAYFEFYDPSVPAQVDCLRYCIKNILMNKFYTVAVE